MPLALLCTTPAVLRPATVTVPVALTVTSGVPVLAKGDVKPFGRLEHGEKRFIDPLLAKERAYRKSQPGEYLLTTRDLTPDARDVGALGELGGIKIAKAGQGALSHPYKLPGQRRRLQASHRVTNGVK